MKNRLSLTALAISLIACGTIDDRSDIIQRVSGGENQAIPYDCNNSNSRPNACSMSYGNCKNTLGDYPYPFLEDRIIVYGDNVSNNAIENVRAGLMPEGCEAYMPSPARPGIALAFHYSQISVTRGYNLVVLGNSRDNRVTEELLGQTDQSSLEQKSSRFVITENGSNKKALIIQGEDQRSLEESTQLLANPCKFRENLARSRQSCSQTF